MKKLSLALLVLVSLTALQGCTNREVGTALGAAGGAGLGYAIGGGWGAAAGAAGGAMAGDRLSR